MKKYFLFALLSAFVFVSCTQKPVKTIENLKAAIKGETTASAKYAAFAEKAKAEKLDTVAQLFLAASKSESIHAANHTKVLTDLGEKMEDFKPEFKVKTTAENLQAAIEGENYENTKMYPDFIAVAQTEKADKAVKSFTWATDTEKKHEEFYKKALAAVQAKSQKGLSFNYYVCPVCGNTYEAASVENKCAFCLAPKVKFEKI